MPAATGNVRKYPPGRPGRRLALATAILAGLPAVAPAETGDVLRTWSPASGVDFGQAVALDGDTIVVVGAVGRDDSEGNYVSMLDAGADQQTVLLPGSDQTRGVSIAVGGDFTAVGLLSADASGSVNLTNAGMVLLTDHGKVIERELRASDAASFDQLGASLAMDGDMVIAGSRGTSNPGAAYVFDAGAAYVFDAATGAQVIKLLPEDNGGGQFGAAVDLCGNTAIVGAPMNPETGGAAHVFDITTGAQRFRLTLADADEATSLNNDFGTAVAVFGRVLLVSAPKANGVGVVLIFDAQTGAQVGRLDPPAGDRDFGQSIAVDRQTAVITGSGPEPVAGDFSATQSVCYLFDIPSGELLQRIAPRGAVHQFIPPSVAVSNNRAVFGASGASNTVEGAQAYPGGVYLIDTGAEARPSAGCETDYADGLPLPPDPDQPGDDPTNGDSPDPGPDTSVNEDLILTPGNGNGSGSDGDPDIAPMPAAPCGFGAGFASLLTLVSLTGCRRRRSLCLENHEGRWR